MHPALFTNFNTAFTVTLENSLVFDQVCVITTDSVWARSLFRAL